ncbi:MAG: peptidoglycan editing factor PgeF [Clostridiales bacterium]|jgi:YfiH family protein|nr:peptidoglycan editing factor PgeF [Clostridiales bacterium]
MELITHNNMPIAVFPRFLETGLVSHGISTRAGGVSSGAWESLNLGFHRGDDRSNVMENFRRFTDALGVPLQNTVFSAQTHGTYLRRVYDSDKGKGIGPSDISQTDGLYTNEPGVALVTFCADCAPLLFFDPVKKVIAASHSGWRGTAAQIGRITVETLNNEFGCNPKDILAGVGPSIGPCCFETDAPVAGEFLKNPAWVPYVKGPYGADKYKVDLWRVNKQILEDAGLDPRHIDCEPVCTRCNENLFYSHRRDGGKRGSLAAIICLTA